MNLILKEFQFQVESAGGYQTDAYHDEWFNREVLCPAIHPGTGERFLSDSYQRQCHN